MFRMLRYAKFASILFSIAAWIFASRNTFQRRTRTIKAIRRALKKFA